MFVLTLISTCLFFGTEQDRNGKGKVRTERESYEVDFQLKKSVENIAGR